MHKIVHVVGARPNFMKIAPIMRAFDAHNRTLQDSDNAAYVEQTLVHTGQHYSKEMSELLFQELELPEPDINLGVGSGGQGEQTGKIMILFEKFILELKPDLVIVVGDVNSTIACALVAKKLNIPVAHVEAGLRSRDMTMPEEINRVMTDAISDLMFTTEMTAEENLKLENVPEDKIKFVGNTMIDSLLSHREKALKKPTLATLGLLNDNEIVSYAVVTLHRPSNVDNKEILSNLISVIETVSVDLTIVFPIHPRTKLRLQDYNLFNRLEKNKKVLITGPQGYLDFMNLTANAKIILSDSGGIQEEATVHKVPCLTLRENTERPVTISHGTNRLVGTEKDEILKAYKEAMMQDFSKINAPKLWDGRASTRIAKEIGTYISHHKGANVE